MTEYVPEVGHKVRATLGESVVIGRVGRADGNVVDVVVNDADYVLVAASPINGWRFKRIQELPTKRWAMVGHPTEPSWSPYIFDGEQWWEISRGGRVIRSNEETVRSFVDDDGFTDLFDGVDA